MTPRASKHSLRVSGSVIVSEQGFFRQCRCPAQPADSSAPEPGLDLAVRGTPAIAGGGSRLGLPLPSEGPLRQDCGRSRARGVGAAGGERRERGGGGAQMGAKRDGKGHAAFDAMRRQPRVGRRDLSTPPVSLPDAREVTNSRGRLAGQGSRKCSHVQQTRLATGSQR